MMREGKLSRRSAISGKSLGRHAMLGSLVCAFALHSIACQGDVQDDRAATSATSGSGSGGAGGMAGSGGMGGNGAMGGSGGMGGFVDGGSGPVEYFAYNLFTHVPRFIIFKADHTRNLCFRIWMEGFGGGMPLTIDVTAPWAADHAEVTNNVGDCSMSNGFPPQPMSSANAISGTGTIVIEGTFPCSLSVHATLSFDPIEPWIPMTESFDADALPVDGGCG